MFVTPPGSERYLPGYPAGHVALLPGHTRVRGPVRPWAFAPQTASRPAWKTARLQHHLYTRPGKPASSADYYGAQPPFPPNCRSGSVAVGNDRLLSPRGSCLSEQRSGNSSSLLETRGNSRKQLSTRPHVSVVQETTGHSCQFDVA